jgi:hypothetical protein
MSTIAASVAEGVMASDSFWFDGDECGTIRKVYRVRGALLGFAGGVREWSDWLAAVRKSPNDPPLIDDLMVLRLSAAGLHTWNSTDGWLPVDEPRYAIGTGGKCARGAMAAGATCREAVRIATSIDANTGGPVRVYRL